MSGVIIVKRYYLWNFRSCLKHPKQPIPPNKCTEDTKYLIEKYWSIIQMDKEGRVVQIDKDGNVTELAAEPKDKK